jgi:hypothetical protein
MYCNVKGKLCVLVLLWLSSEQDYRNVSHARQTIYGV